MKETCEECKAFEFTDSTTRKCSLGYWQEKGVPKEECPKPRTTKKFVTLMKESYNNETKSDI